MNTKLTSKSDSWMTPEGLVYLAREVLGTIDLDPASTGQANQVIKATTFLTEKEDGLLFPWCSLHSNVSVFLNPPGGLYYDLASGSRYSKTGMFWAKLMLERSKGNIKHAIFIGFSIELLQLSQNYHDLSVLSFPICVPKSRIRFVDPIEGVSKSPTHGNVIVYVPGIVNNTDKFITEFSKIGVCKR